MCEVDNLFSVGNVPLTLSRGYSLYTHPHHFYFTLLCDIPGSALVGCLYGLGFSLRGRLRAR